MWLANWPFSKITFFPRRLLGLKRPFDWYHFYTPFHFVTLSLKGTVAWDFLVWFFFRESTGLGVWLKCQYSVFRFLVISMSFWRIPFYLPCIHIDGASKKSVLRWPPNFLLVNHTSSTIIPWCFFSNILWLDCCRTLFSFKFTCHVNKSGKILLAAFIYAASNYLLHI